MFHWIACELSALTYNFQQLIGIVTVSLFGVNLYLFSTMQSYSKYIILRCRKQIFEKANKIHSVGYFYCFTYFAARQYGRRLKSIIINQLVHSASTQEIKLNAASIFHSQSKQTTVRSCFIPFHSMQRSDSKSSTQFTIHRNRFVSHFIFT